MMANYFHCKKSDLIEITPMISSSTLTVQEQELLSHFRKLNETGKDKACEAIRDLTDIARYTEQVAEEKTGT